MYTLSFKAKIFWGLFFVFAFAIGTIYLFRDKSCEEFDYKRADVIRSLIKLEPDFLLGSNSSEFPSKDWLFPSKVAPKDQVEIFDYTFLLECGELKNAARIRLVRFKVKDQELFADKRINISGSASDPKISSGGVVPWDVYRPLRSNWYKDSWLLNPALPKVNSDYIQGRKNMINSFKIDWLKDEPLGEAEFVGLWRGGWLFRSKNPDQYVWID
jgi:hypothetical protein